MFADVKPICLPDPTQDFNKVTALVTGWGNTRFRGNQSEILKKAWVTTFHCKKSDYPERRLTKNMICAQGADTDACNGDSGGPLAVRGQDGYYSQIGIVSWGKKCAIAGQPGVYTNLVVLLPWLTKTIKRPTGAQAGVQSKKQNVQQ